jgi:uncharacterized protein DUF6894
MPHYGLCMDNWNSGMTRYSFFVWNSRDRVKYPRSYDLPDVAAARKVAVKIADIFIDVLPNWSDLSFHQRNTFVVEIVDETGQTILTVPFREAKQPAS